MSVRASLCLSECVPICVCVCLCKCVSMCVCVCDASCCCDCLSHKIPKVIILIQHEPQVCCIHFQAKRKPQKLWQFYTLTRHTPAHTHTCTHPLAQTARPFSAAFVFVSVCVCLFKANQHKI